MTSSLLLFSRRWKIVVLCGLAGLAVFFGGYLTGRNVEPSAKDATAGSVIPAAGLKSGAGRVPANRNSPEGAGGGAALTEENAMEVYARILREPDPLRRQAEFASLLAAADAAGIEALKKAVGAHYNDGGRLPDDLAVPLHTREGQLMTKEALAAILPKEPNGDVHVTLLRKMRGWAGVDAEASHDFLLSLEPGSVKDRLQKEWLGGLSGETVAKAFAILPPEGKMQVLDRYVSEMHNQGGMEAVAGWFDKLSKDPASSPAVVEKAFTNTAARYAQNPGGGAAAIRYVLDHAAERYVTSSALSTINYYLGRYNPGPCLEMLSELQNQRPDLAGIIPGQVSETLRHASTGSLNNVAQWLNDHPDFPLRDVTARNLAERLRVDDPDSAAHWARSIKDEALRAETMGALGLPPVH